MDSLKARVDFNESYEIDETVLLKINHILVSIAIELRPTVRSGTGQRSSMIFFNIMILVHSMGFQGFSGLKRRFL